MIIGPCRIVTGGPEPCVLEDAAVRVVGAHVAQIASAGTLAAAHPDDMMWPARGRLLMPGLVNAHAHVGRHLARGLSLRTPAEWDRYDRALSPEDVRWAAVAAMVEGVRHGVTTVCDFHRSGGCLDLSLAEVVGAAKAVGVRVAACYGASEDDPPAERRAAIEESLGLARDVARRREGRQQALLGVHARSLAGVERLIEESFAAAGGGLAVHVDLALDATPGERWNGGDLWSDDARPALWAHADCAPRGLVGLAQERGDALSATGAGSLTALARVADLAWGSDGAVNAPPLLDGGPAAPFDPGLARAHYKRVFVTGSEWAANHFGERLGRIEAGAPADLLLVDYRPATELSARTLLAHVASGLLRAPVSGVMVAGEIVMDNGVLVNVDETRVAARAQECSRRVWERLT